MDQAIREQLEMLTQDMADRGFRICEYDSAVDRWEPNESSLADFYADFLAPDSADGAYADMGIGAMDLLILGG